MAKFLVLVCGLVCVLGCAGQARLVNALAKDPATVHLKHDIDTIYGKSHFEFDRNTQRTFEEMNQVGPH